MYTKHVEGRGRTFYFMPFPDGSYPQKKVLMDFTDRAKNAIKRDTNLGYENGDGPHFGIEVQRAHDYMMYVREYAMLENIIKFGTRAYTFVIHNDGEAVNRSRKEGDDSSHVSES